MELVTNLTSHAVGHCVGRTLSGEVEFTCIAKATFTWGPDGRVAAVEAEPLRARDEHRGPEANPILVAPAELMPAKPKVDVLVVGNLKFPAPTERIDVTLELGTRLRKSLRVFGDRSWMPTAQSELRPSRPKPIAGIPVGWEKSFGGADPQDPSVFEARNPAGLGLRRDPRTLAGTPLPNFESPAEPIDSPAGRPTPVGFGPVAGHWMPRSKLAGTYDQRWKDQRYPLLPADFSPSFFNVAPADQQVDGYVAGEELRLLQMTPAGRERIVLPDFALPVTFVTADSLIDTTARVDTIIVDPERRRLSLLARAIHVPRPDIQSFRGVFVGVQSRGVRRALETGKQYLRMGPAVRTRASG
jgi:hypothetical protein